MWQKTPTNRPTPCLPHGGASDARQSERSAVERDDRTGELFGEVETICALAEMPDGAVISGALLMAARKEWR